MKYILFSIFLLCGLQAQAQESGYYYMYDFEDFARAKTTGYNDLMIQLYRTFKYPDDWRKNEIEGEAKIYIISHGNGAVEFLPSEKSNEFHDHVLPLLETVEGLQLRSTEKFITELIINFDLEPFDQIKDKTNTIYIVQYKTPVIRYDSSTN